MKHLTLAALVAAAGIGAARADEPAHGHSAEGPAMPGTAMATKPMMMGGHGSHGMMGDHMLSGGEVSLGYGFGYMDMSGLMIGDSQATPADALARPSPFPDMMGQPQNYRAIPDWMTTEKHVIEAAYGATDWLTLRVRGSYLKKSMEMLVFNPSGTALVGTSSGTSSGVGDTEVAALVRLYENGRTHVHATLGASLPTGSITEEGSMLSPMGTVMTMRRPYGMQLGSGTFDLLPGISATRREGRLAYGARVEGVLRLGENDEGYSLGDGASGTLWGSVAVAPGLRAQASVTGSAQGAIDGFDPQIRSLMTTADPANYGGERIDLGLGLGYMPMHGPLEGVGVMVEARLPVYQNLNGPQLGTNFAIMAGLRLSF